MDDASVDDPRSSLSTGELTCRARLPELFPVGEGCAVCAQGAGTDNCRDRTGGIACLTERENNVAGTIRWARAAYEAESAETARIEYEPFQRREGNCGVGSCSWA